MSSMRTLRSRTQFPWRAVGIFFSDGEQLVFDNLKLELFACEDRFQFCDELDDLAVFVLNFFPL